jgi:acetyl esterase/lipase
MNPEENSEEEFETTHKAVLSLSKEANDFILDSKADTIIPIEITPEGLADLRQGNSEMARLGWNRIKDGLNVEIQNDRNVNGVTVQWIIPHQIQGDEVVLYFFGGGFVCGCPDDDLSISARIAVLIGRRVCVPDYKLSAEYPQPIAREQAIEVYRSLCIEQGLRLFVVGESAGGNLALQVILEVLNRENEGYKPPLAVALLSPWTDLSFCGRSQRKPSMDPTLTIDGFIKQASFAYINGFPSEKDKLNNYSIDINISRSPKISPLFADYPSNFPPTTISTGTIDLLLSDCTRLASKLQRVSKNPVDIQIYQGLWHVFEWYPQLPESMESLGHIVSFLSQYL